jgi:hypothetical protein
VSAEQARFRFEEYLTEHHDQLTPLWLGDIYMGLYNSYLALVDEEKATEYADKHYNLKVKLDQFSSPDRSKARHTLAVSRLALLKTTLPSRSVSSRSGLVHGSLNENRARCLNMAAAEIMYLEK